MPTSKKKSIFAFHKPEKSSGYDFTVTTAPRFHLVPYVTGGLRLLYSDIKGGRERLDENHGWATDENGIFQLVDDGCKIGLRYKCTKILGHGQSSVFVQAEDQFCDGALVAIKVLHAQYFGLGAQESQCLMRLNRADPHCISGVVRIKTVFVVGSHYCMVFESLSPAPLTNSFIDCPRLQVLSKLRQAAGGLLKVLGFLHQQSVIHADLKPENILLQTADDVRSLKVIDFGNALHCIHDEVSTYYDDFDLQTLIYRAPEVLYGMPFGTEVDLWSLGCVLAEMYLQKPLFLGRNKKEVLGEMVDLLGHVPSRVVQRGKFYPDLEAYTTYNYTQPDATSKLLKRLNHLDFAFANFISSLLRYDPVERATVSRAAAHVFLGSELATRLLMPPECDTDGGNVYPGLCITSRMYKHQPVVDVSIKYQHLTSQELLRTGTHDLTAAPRRCVAEVAPVRRSISPEEMSEVAPARRNISPEEMAEVAPVRRIASPQVAEVTPVQCSGSREDVAEGIPVQSNISPEVTEVTPLERSVSPEEEVVLLSVVDISDVVQSHSHNHYNTNTHTKLLNSNYKSKVKQSSTNHNTVRTEIKRNSYRTSRDNSTIHQQKNDKQSNTSRRHTNSCSDSDCSPENGQDSEVLNQQQTHIQNYDNPVWENKAVTGRVQKHTISDSESNEQIDHYPENLTLAKHKSTKINKTILKSKYIKTQLYTTEVNNQIQSGERIKEEVEEIHELMQLKSEAGNYCEITMRPRNMIPDGDYKQSRKNAAIPGQQQTPLQLKVETLGHIVCAQRDEACFHEGTEHDQPAGKPVRDYKNRTNNSEKNTSRTNQPTATDCHCLIDSSRDCIRKVCTRSKPDASGTLHCNKDGFHVHTHNPTGCSKRQLSNSVSIEHAPNSSKKLHEVRHGNNQHKALPRSATLPKSLQGVDDMCVKNHKTEIKSFISDSVSPTDDSLISERHMRTLTDKNIVQSNSHRELSDTNKNTLNKLKDKSPIHNSISESTFSRARHKSPTRGLHNSTDKLPNAAQNSDKSPNIKSMQPAWQNADTMSPCHVTRLQKSANTSQRNNMCARFKNTSQETNKKSKRYPEVIAQSCKNISKISTGRTPRLNNQVNSSSSNDILLKYDPGVPDQSISYHQNVLKDRNNASSRRHSSISKDQSASSTTFVCMTDSASDAESSSDAVKFIYKARSPTNNQLLDSQPMLHEQFPSDMTYVTIPSNKAECNYISQVSSKHGNQATVTEKISFSDRLPEYMEQNCSEQTPHQIVESTDLDSSIGKCDHGHFHDEYNHYNEHLAKRTSPVETVDSCHIMNTSTGTNLTVKNYLKPDKTEYQDKEPHLLDKIFTDNDNCNDSLETSTRLADSVNQAMRSECAMCSPKQKFYVTRLTPHHAETRSLKADLPTISTQKLASITNSRFHSKVFFNDNSDNKAGHSYLPSTATAASMKELEEDHRTRKRLKVTDHDLIDRSDSGNKTDRLIKHVKPLEVNDSNEFDNRSKFVTSDSAKLVMGDNDSPCLARRRLQMLPDHSIKYSHRVDVNAYVSSKTLLNKEHLSKAGKRKRLLEDDCIKSVLSPNRVHISYLEKHANDGTNVSGNCSDTNLKATGKASAYGNSGLKQTQYLNSKHRHSKMNSKGKFPFKQGNKQSRSKSDVFESGQFFSFINRENKQSNSCKKRVSSETFISSNDIDDHFHFKSDTESETEMAHRISNVKRRYNVKIKNKVEPIHKSNISKHVTDEKVQHSHMHTAYKSVSEEVTSAGSRNTDCYSSSTTNRWKRKTSMKPQLSEHLMESRESNESLYGQSVNAEEEGMDSGPTLDDDIEEEVLLLSL